jgi:hypothetical protein
MRKKPWDGRTQQATDEVQVVIKAAFPEAEFQVHRGGDPEGIYIDAYTKADNGFDVLYLIGDRQVDICVEDGRVSMWFVCTRLNPDPMLVGHRLRGDHGVFLSLSSLSWRAGLMGSRTGCPSFFAVSIHS